MTGDRFYEQPAESGRRHAPAAERNAEAIAQVLDQWLPDDGLVLEVASGTGEHVAKFARRFERLRWQPSDCHPAALASIEAWRGGAANVERPVTIDVASKDWPIIAADALLAINLVHISAWEASLGLLDGAARVLGPGAPLIVYGPWIERGIALAPSNLAFDVDLRSRDSQWGLREVEAFAQEASARGLAFLERRAMPANNLMLLFRRA